MEVPGGDSHSETPAPEQSMDPSPSIGPTTSSQPTQSMDDSDDHHMCRVCRGDDGHLYYPCLCTGSIKYVHQECLTEWLKYSKKEVCELCNYKYSFQPIYRHDMPKALPLAEILKERGDPVQNGVIDGEHHRNEEHGEENEHEQEDGELADDDDEQEEELELLDADVRAEHEVHQNVGNAGGYDRGGPAELPDNPQPRAAEQPALEVPPVEDNWRDLDRLGDELTWQRLLGLDGSLVFLERVVWVISLDTLFTIMFAYAPYKLGFYILSKCGVQQSIHYFPSIAAILTGYVAVTAIIYVLHYFVGVLRLASLYRVLGICFLVLKVFLLVLIEIGFFPIICGCWMDLCSLKLFSASLSSRASSFAASPTSSVFIHWMIGMVYVFYFASFVLLLREVLRPGVLWFMRNLNDPEFNPIQEVS
ncbi:zinc finger, C3HC4 type [Ancylostoma ceylanicum]|uniref:RING-type E3 ubiquitin transferase n=1 Tax=Ancylostoma ceylanicum TaxID=53326 RepID=A0A0D6LNU0_9BILA|nr:zinc finger, C3HC4 type [Ancylostoma ceylanicum]